jgi:hypothetical protein
VASAAQVLGLAPERVQQALAAAQEGGTTGRNDSGDGRASLGAAAGGGTGSGAARNARAGGIFGGRYIVFVKRPGGPEPVWVRTGLTDMDYSEVREGLAPTDSVLVLPSASLVQSQQESQERINRMTGGGGLPGMRQQGSTGTEGGTRVEIQRSAPPAGNR